MNFVLDNYHVDEKNISFLETKKNNIIDGNFTKIIYKDTFVTVNGIYLLFPVTVTGVDKSNGKTNVFFNPKIASNTSIINHISDIEGKIINCYKQEYNVSYKRNMSTLFNLLYNGKVKLYKEINYNPSRVNIVTNHGFTRETNVYVGQRSYTSLGVKRTESRPDTLSGCLDDSIGGPEMPSILLRSSPSGDADKRFLDSFPRIDFDSAQPKVVQGWDRMSPTDSKTDECGAVREKLRFSDQNSTKIVLKISGIWETANEIGITYKFLDMH